MKKILIRFNHNNDGTGKFWRIIFADTGEELHADEVKILCSSFTTKDTMQDGSVKFHITVLYEDYFWNNGLNIITIR